MKKNRTNSKVTANIEEIKRYWSKDNIPQIWYSSKDKLTLQFFNEISSKRFSTYYPYLNEYAEFREHSGEKILEIGVGAGTDLVRFYENGAICTGVDLGPDQIKLTELNFASRGYDIPELSVQNAEKLNFDSSEFDYVYSFGVLHHTPNTKEAINEIHRVLKADGTATVMLYARGWKHYLKRCLIQGILRGKYFKYGNWQSVYNYASEVHGSSPLTYVYTKKQIYELFQKFEHIEIHKLRMGEFFDYAPYGTFKFPKFISSISNFFNFQGLLGENYIIKAYKKKNKNTSSILKTIFSHY